MPAMEAPTFRSVLTWAAYLACSWTWCIGMWLPVILMRDFGPWSFLLFAIPNIAGAAAMGVVLRRPGASEKFVASHRSACHAFSFVTIAFQTFFLIWILAGTGGNLLLKIGFFAVFLAPAMLVGDTATGSSRSRTVGLLVYVISLVCLGWWFAAGAPRAYGGPPPDAGALASLAAVCLFGFLLCPYLDLTFHHARQRLPGDAGNAAFSIGFGAFFFLMILFTFLYAQPVLVEAGGMIPNPTLAGLAVVIHMLLQLGYTQGVHSAALRDEAARPSIFSGLGGAGAIVAALLLFFMSPVDNETIYRGFMGMYGLVFPAYVAVCVRPDLAPPRRTDFAAFMATLVIAGPMFYFGFMQQIYGWLGVGVGVVAAAAAVVRIRWRVAAVSG